MKNLEIKFDYSKLKGRIVEKCVTNTKFAELLGCTNNTISAKLNNNSEFSQGEIIKAVDILGLERQDIPKYFFTIKV